MAIKNLNIRIPEELHARVKQSAGTDRRSLNSQILWLIETGLGARDEEPNASR